MLTVGSSPREISAETIRYASCAIRHGERLLMIQRLNEPNAGLANIVGGKLEPGESPADCALREAFEETGVRLSAVRFAGIVTWNTDTIAYAKHRALGMYVFVGELPTNRAADQVEADTPEGRLVWRAIDDVVSGASCYVDNLRFFLGAMLAVEEPAEYHCEYGRGDLVSVTTYPLAASLRELAEVPAVTRQLDVSPGEM